MQPITDTNDKLQLNLSFAGYTSQGIKDINQDAFSAFTPAERDVKLKGITLCVADGVSSSDRSHEASNTAVTSFINDYYSTPQTWSVKKSAAQVLQALNSWLCHQGRGDFSQQNSLVTTFSAVVFKSTTAHIFHIGDTRIYRWRNDSLELLTRDHTHNYQGQKNILYRALGIDPLLEVDHSVTDIEPGDMFLLTSDGVHDYIDEKNLHSFLSVKHLSLATCAKSLVDYALNQGSSDNLTCLITKVENTPNANLDEIHRCLTKRVIPPAMRQGNKIDHYYVEKVIHAGSRSHVYLVRDLETKKLCVLKAPSQNFSENLHYLDGFINEQWIGQTIDHKSVMKIYPHDKNSNFLYHVCEYVQGISLRDWMRENPNPSIVKIRPIIEPLIKALRVLQRLNIVHRDLKPENVLIDHENNVKLIDFGTVKVDSLTEISNQLQDECPAGTAGYTAPEYFFGETGCHQSDIFSLGVIIYEMLSAKLPFTDLNHQGKITRYYSDWSYISLKTFSPDIPTWLDLTVQKACHPDPKHRYSAMSELSRDLNRPNPTFLEDHRKKPLIERNPVLVWRSISIILMIIVLVQFFWMSQNT